ncbi:MAG: regulatory protein RecX [Ruminococcus sp.]|uniref:regulatory protein RecX n=1 Tax=Ruminococcus sp. TaxID=41978 RepID=UPI002872AFF8|nr:regulatory protein RecX [Ruminococcus sp.]MBQ3285259.1 regulatory protein RecX [Ruminococcus sp.]
MQITAVEPRKKGLSALYIDGEFAMKLDTEVLIARRFDVGREIDDEQLHECVQASDQKRCKDKAMWLISYRDHSRKDLFDKLRRDYPDDICEAAVARLEELGLIDDGRYARRYAADLVSLKHLSERGVRQKLYEKGIDRDLIDEVVGELFIDEKEQIRTIIDKKYARSLDDEKGRRRCVNALSRMGFSWSDIKSVLNEYIDVSEE